MGINHARTVHKLFRLVYDLIQDSGRRTVEITRRKSYTFSLCGEARFSSGFRDVPSSFTLKHYILATARRRKRI